ncbi:predicted protein [Nematostella vectensis]|uniref:Uncharacterized protein n=1 Tax=Nematostella vectensis TaxID=45351 RepID=A7RLD2_NEMVE|nr:predicted protein [Nematostella vectensis]|eukprot:XP_001639646.1 predicted protein [Nematostella vectensis]
MVRVRAYSQAFLIVLLLAIINKSRAKPESLRERLLLTLSLAKRHSYEKHAHDSKTDPPCTTTPAPRQRDHIPRHPCAQAEMTIVLDGPMGKKVVCLVPGTEELKERLFHEEGGYNKHYVAISWEDAKRDFIDLLGPYENGTAARALWRQRESSVVTHRKQWTVQRKIVKAWSTNTTSSKIIKHREKILGKGKGRGKQLGHKIYATEASNYYYKTQSKVFGKGKQGYNKENGKKTKTHFFKRLIQHQREAKLLGKNKQGIERTATYSSKKLTPHRRGRSKKIKTGKSKSKKTLDYKKVHDKKWSHQRLESRPTMARKRQKGGKQDNKRKQVKKSQHRVNRLLMVGEKKSGGKYGEKSTHRRVRRDDVTLERCAPAGRVTAKGIHLCPVCQRITRLPDYYFPQYLNELTCDMETSASVVSPFCAFGRCFQNSIYQEFLVRDPDSYELVSQNASHVVYRAVFNTATHPIKTCCDCIADGA